VGEGSVREDLPDDRGIVEGGDQAQPAPTMATGQDVNGKCPVHEGRPAPGARTALRKRHQVFARAALAPKPRQAVLEHAARQELPELALDELR